MSQLERKQNRKKRTIFWGIGGLAVLVTVMAATLVLRPETLPDPIPPVPVPSPAVSAEPVKQPDPDTGETVSIINPEGNTLRARIAPPPGYERVEAEPDSLVSFLREYPLKKAGKPVLLYNGEEKGNRGAHVAVFKLPLEKEDLQQCADTVMRVYAEYFWKTGQKERISFRFVDGFQAEYSKWRSGYRIRAEGSRSSWVPGGAYDDSYANFKKYLRMVFAYASTLSMEHESKKIKLSKVEAGDIFLEAGSPGHVVMVVDVCESADGKKAFLLGQGYMPAQEFHLLKNPSHEEDPWYYVEDISYPLWTPEYSFEKGSFRRLDY